MISPNTSALLNLLVAVLGALGSATAEWTTLFGQSSAQQIVAGIGITVTIISGVNAALHGVSSADAGPLVKTTLGPKG
jgi:hypothetical protein